VLCTSGESGKLHWIETGEFDWRRGVHSGVHGVQENQSASFTWRAVPITWSGGGPTCQTVVFAAAAASSRADITA